MESFFKQLWETILSGQTWRGEIVNRRKDGSLYVADLAITPVSDESGRIQNFVAIMQDITRRKEAQDALRRSEDRYRSLFENANDLVYTRDLAGNIISMNRAGERILGYAREEILRMNIHDLVAPEFLSKFREQVRAALAGESPPPIEIEVLAKDGHRVQMEFSRRVIVEDDEPVGFQVIARDITERKRLEAQVSQSQRIEAIGRLAGGVAHDFNNLLGVILGYTDLIIKGLDSNDPQTRRLEQVKRAAERGATLTRQLLAFSRKQVMEPKILDLNLLVSDMSTMLQRLIGEDIKLVSLPAPSLARVKVDPGQIEQVIMNLAVNARDAMPAGGTPTIETGNVELDQDYFNSHVSGSPGWYVLLAVSDTGTGMDATTQAQIFEPFFTTKEKGKGTGLGLATVYGVVKQSGGYIWVYSEPGHGTTFKLYFPRVVEAESPVEAVAAARTIPGGSETILLVEDAAPLRELARLFLEGAGYQVLEANSGPEALEKSRKHDGPIHLLVTDVIMPGMSGPDLAQKLLAEHTRMKVIYISGYTDDAIAHHGVLASGVALLGKPFTREALTRKVREVLDRPEPSKP